MRFNFNDFKLNAKYSDKWFQLSGDVNAKDHGGLFIRCDAYSIYVVKYSQGCTDDEYGYDSDDNPCRFYMSEHGFDMADLTDGFNDYSTFTGISDGYYDDNDGSKFVTDCITAATDYGLGLNDSNIFTAFSKAIKTIGLRTLPSKWIPSDYFVPVD